MRLFWNMRAALFGPLANTVHFTTAVHPVHVRYRIKPILLYPDYSYISYRSIRKPSVVYRAILIFMDPNFTGNGTG